MASSTSTAPPSSIALLLAKFELVILSVLYYEWYITEPLSAEIFVKVDRFIARSEFIDYIARPSRYGFVALLIVRDKALIVDYLKCIKVELNNVAVILYSTPILFFI